MPLKVLSYYRTLGSDKTLLKGLDHGQDAETERTVGEYVRTSAIPDIQAELLHRLVAFLKPRNVLELGTNLGKSLAAMATGNSGSEFVGVEGNAALAEHASRSMNALDVKNAKVVHDTFDHFLEGGEQYDLVFLDGDHRYEPTMRFYSSLKAKLREGGAIIFHDIYWSEGMQRAWEEIKKDRDVVVTVDLFFMGIVWFGKPQAKEDFSIRFPLQLVSLIF